MARKKAQSYGQSRTRRKGLSQDQVRFNRTATARKGPPGSKKWKSYVFGHATNVKKGRA